MFKAVQSRFHKTFQPSGPTGKVLFAIGDVHGCDAELQDVLSKISEDIERHSLINISIVFLGDLIDRGPDSRRVVTRAMQLVEQSPRNLNAILLAGNHEDALVRAADGDGTVAANWIKFGGDTTLASYGLCRDDFEFMDEDNLATLIKNTIPKEHIGFLRRSREMALFGDFVLVHAGVDPELPIHEQTRRSLLWIREPFLSHPKPIAPPHCVVHGHTIVENVEHHGRRIAIDTGVYNTGRLSCLRIHETHLSTYTTGLNMGSFKPLDTVK